MKLLFLCGGKATRLRGVNNSIPKSLLQVQKQSILSSLIRNLSPYSSDFFISYADGEDYYKETLKTELDDFLMQKVIFMRDEFQMGTAFAVQLHSRMIEGDFCVLNGDTLFSDYSKLLPPRNGDLDVCFSTSYQEIGRSTQIIENQNDESLHFKKDDMGCDELKGNVTNGVIYLSVKSINWLQGQNFKEKESIEEVLISQNKNIDLSYGFHQSRAEYVDFGTPDEYLNPDKFMAHIEQKNST